MKYTKNAYFKFKALDESQIKISSQDLKAELLKDISRYFDQESLEFCSNFFGLLSEIRLH